MGAAGARSILAPIGWVGCSWHFHFHMPHHPFHHTARFFSGLAALLLLISTTYIHVHTSHCNKNKLQCASACYMRLRAGDDDARPTRHGVAAHGGGAAMPPRWNAERQELVHGCPTFAGLVVCGLCVCGVVYVSFTRSEEFFSFLSPYSSVLFVSLSYLARESVHPPIIKLPALCSPMIPVGSSGRESRAVCFAVLERLTT